MPRQHDWLVSDAGWNSAIISVSPATTLLVPLTSSPSQQTHVIDPVNVRPDAPEVAMKMTVERVVGTIYMVYSDMEPGTASEQQTELVLEVLDADLDGVPLVPGDLDYTDAWSANRAFMWHHHLYAANLTTWWTDRPGYGQWNRIDVDVRVRRTIEHNQVLTLIVDNSYDPPNGALRVGYHGRLRTLVSW